MNPVPAVVLASIADDPLMGAITAAFAKAGLPMTRVSLDATTTSDEAHEARFLAALEACGEGRKVIGGFSLGARIAAQLCNRASVLGLLCVGYPFHAARAPSDRHGLDALSRVACPTRIIQGTRDNHGSLAEVKGYTLPDTVELVWLEDGNHRLAPRERSAHTLEQHVDAAAASAMSFALSFGGCS